MEKRFKNGLVLGKFLPPHKGHLYLIDTALNNCETVHLMVCHNPSQPIDGNLRYNALKNIYNGKNINIYNFNDSHLPQYENECDTLDEFYDGWVNAVYSLINDLDVVFTSEDYGDDFANYLGVEHYLVDKERVKYPVSGTKIRTNPFEYWHFIPNEIKPHFVKRIAIMGPESCGKSTLTENLAKYYSTNFVHEYGRDIWEKYDGGLKIKNFKEISLGRQDLEDKLIYESNKIIISDTEDITTYIFSKMYCPDTYTDLEEWFLKRIESQYPYDIYILLSPDCEAVQDGTRQHLNERWEHFEEIKNELQKRNANYKIVGGSWDNRFNESIKIVNKLFS